MRTSFFIALLLTTAISCNKPEPNPETQDKIYLDLLNELSETQKMSAETEANLQEYKLKLRDVIPQSGQIHYVEKRIYEFENQHDKLEQQIKYWTLRSESRRDYVRKKSLESFNKGEKWSNEKEFEEYTIQKKMFHARHEWSGRQRREEFLEQEAKSKKSSEVGGADGEEKKSE